MVFIIPEWWGMNDYVKNRARQLADSGYMVVAVDMYGEGKWSIIRMMPESWPNRFMVTPILQNKALSWH